MSGNQGVGKIMIPTSIIIMFPTSIIIMFLGLVALFAGLGCSAYLSYKLPLRYFNWVYVPITIGVILLIVLTTYSVHVGIEEHQELVADFSELSCDRMHDILNSTDASDSLHRIFVVECMEMKK